ncbi:ScbA/BarX family gamma-butyrolactone biosynthesis protein [Nocardia puris]|uniref:A-factor biosynthesis hotdog protein n=1 Tax=Nocardia puris TaxID=208602 RepID=A0A366DGF4_9NOCA|nr:ScbA/BarX family gamma-butyrolactone biosynthesis protein [Nocardia puris]RBO88424.1 A-factor biosynthesis hotdog protein [Nocardia puris]
MTTHAAAEKAATHISTIPRQLAHRCAVSEVFVTSLDTLGPDSFLVGAQLPRMHAYYGDHAGSQGLRHDPLLVMEAARQAAIALTHEFYGVPTDRAFVVRTFNGTGADTRAWETGVAPSDLVMRVRAPNHHRRGDVLHGLDMVLEIFADGEPMFTVDGSFSWTTASHWTALRDGFRKSLGLGPFRGAAPIGERADAASVGRGSKRNVVIGPPERDGDIARADLVSDLSHPFLFDHQLDHVPGSLLIEACRQIGLSLVLPELPRPVSVASTFERFVELDLPAECVGEIIESGAGTAVVRGEIRQAGAVAARVDVEFAGDALDAEPIVDGA